MPNTEEPVVEEVETTTTEETPTTTTETTTSTNTRLSDDDVERVANSVFGKVKTYSESLIAAAQEAAQIAQDMLPPTEAPPPDGAPPPTEEPPPPDTGPQRRHGIFGQPFKRRDS